MAPDAPPLKPPSTGIWRLGPWIAPPPAGWAVLADSPRLAAHLARLQMGVIVYILHRASRGVKWDGLS